MAQQTVAELFRAAQANSNLRNALNQASSIEKFIEMAKDYGYDFTLAEWKAATGFSVEEIQGELSEIPGV
ncbi:Nif11-like leader peptide family natural product precursor [filamentous cyanobacterium LEGE 11480]|uniref:Nif11-like leader peptide family natural product n=1 Tax=Romeriopsis navalis LEGE 11480 TaxID=2777977 RepID=A0A928Z3F5_9CYAN|nr:Nif11-like leader peptide family natural product precursor [Romeriopsis navalis]MBE9031471.1 Nif11-like leader peptide family natural product precursor [Romeriopsis navalis LEGE 11480]